MSALTMPTTLSPRASLIADLKQVVGRQHVVATVSGMRRFTRGYRFGEGQAISAVLPGSLLELWKAVQLCVEANVIVIAQAANTGLTGGSTPFGNDYDRDVVIINTMRVRSVQIIDDGRQVIAFPGTTLDQLEKVLKPLGREPHSVNANNAKSSGIADRRFEASRRSAACCCDGIGNASFHERLQVRRRAGDLGGSSGLAA